eukprot:1152264-Prymnesium_polylepis.1
MRRLRQKRRLLQLRAEADTTHSSGDCEHSKAMEEGGAITTTKVETVNTARACYSTGGGGGRDGAPGRGAAAAAPRARPRGAPAIKGGRILPY